MFMFLLFRILVLVLVTVGWTCGGYAAFPDKLRVCWGCDLWLCVVGVVNCDCHCVLYILL